MAWQYNMSSTNPYGAGVPNWAYGANYSQSAANLYRRPTPHTAPAVKKNPAAKPAARKAPNPLAGLAKPGKMGSLKLPSISSYASQVPRLQLPTQQTQNQQMALGSQAAATYPLMANATGTSGIQASSPLIAARIQPMQIAAQQAGTQAAMNTGLDDQIARDRQLLEGIVGIGKADLGLAGANIDRLGIGVGARNRYIDQLVSLLGGLV